MKYLVFGLIIMCFLNSCKVVFTQELRNRLENQNIDIKSIQYYASKEILLQRVDSERKISTDSNAIIKLNQTVIEKIIIKKNTPAICVNTFDTEIEMQFEDCDSCTLKFCILDTINPKHAYLIGAENWNNHIGKVRYNKQIFYIQPESNAATLLIKPRMSDKWIVKTRIASGKKLKN